MWFELLEIFRSNDPMKVMTDEFMLMLTTTREMANIVRPHLFDHSLSLEGRKRILDLDIKVNKLERSVRKRIIAHLTLQRSHIAYCLLLMTLVKDAERLGDYVKNLTEVVELGGQEIPDGPLREEMSDLLHISKLLMEEAPQSLVSQDSEQATELMGVGRNACKRSDALLVELSKSDLTPAQTASLVLLTRFNKRIISHLVNIVSSIVMPLHKVDYFDPKALEGRKEKK